MGLQEVQYEVRPEHKLAVVKAAAAAGGVLMVGEGINDAPALAAATVGVVVADCASATSLQVADVLLLGAAAGVSNLPFLTYKVNPPQGERETVGSHGRW